jgi:hypothetical protein
LFDERSGRIIENVVYGDDLSEWRRVNAIADLNAALSTNYAILADQAVPADFDS